MSNKIWKIISIVLLVLLIATNVYYFISKPQSTTRNLNFAYQVGFHYGPSIIMDEFDLIEKNSGGRLKGSYFKISGGSTINEAIVAGSIDFAQMGTAPAIKGVDQGLGTKILSSFGSKEHELWTWRDDIQTIADIRKDDVIAVVKINSIEHVGLIKAYIDMGKTKEDADAVSAFFSHSDAYIMMEEGTIDADFTGAPYTTLYANNPRYHKIADDSSIWGMSLAGGVILGKTSFDDWVINIVLESFVEAVEWIEANPKEASKIIGESYDYTEDEAWELWQELPIVWGPTRGLDTIEAQASMMYELGLIEEELKKKDLLFAQTIDMMS